METWLVLGLNSVRGCKSFSEYLLSSPKQQLKQDRIPLLDLLSLRADSMSLLAIPSHEAESLYYNLLGWKLINYLISLPLQILNGNGISFGSFLVSMPLPGKEKKDHPPVHTALY